MKYNQYDIEDFLTDPEFIEWVKNDAQDEASFFNDWLRSNPSNKDKALQAREFLFLLEREAFEPTKEEMDTGLHRLLTTHTLNESQPAKIYSFFNQANILRGIAAVIMLIIGSFFIYTTNFFESLVEPANSLEYKSIIKETAYGQKSLITLPDGSTVKLNAGTKVEFQENFTKNRQITLSGEAFFDVKRDSLHPFTITTKELTITVLGTSFNVDSYKEDKNVNVAVESGLVRVEKSVTNASALETVLLNPREMLAFDRANQQHVKRNFDPLEIAWKDSVLRFVDADFSEVKLQIERWYNFKIIISEEDLKQVPRNINGTFKNKSIEKVLSGLQYALGIKYEVNRKDRTILITK